MKFQNVVNNCRIPAGKNEEENFDEGKNLQIIKTLGSTQKLLAVSKSNLRVGSNEFKKKMISV